jgi:regulator of replication initiation timing
MPPRTTSTAISTLLQSVDPNQIADPSVRQTVELLLNIIEQLNASLKELERENQQLRDENNRLKGEQGKPDIKANSKKGFKPEHSSETERKIPKEHRKSRKKETLKVDREQVIAIPQEDLPADAQFKGYAEVVVQDLMVRTDNIRFLKETYYSPALRKTYIAPLPPGYEGEFGARLKALILSLYYGGNMTQGKVIEFLTDVGISMSGGYLSNLLNNNQEIFAAEFQDLFRAGLASSPWQQFDQPGSRVGGVNQTTNIICNPLYTVYVTTPRKDRLSVLSAFQNTTELGFILNDLSDEILESFNLPLKWRHQLQLLPQNTVLSELELNGLLEQFLAPLNPQTRTRIQEAAAIAFYHQQSAMPIIQALLCDDAPQFKRLTEALGLCWVHEGRHYKKLTPIIAIHQTAVKNFLKEFWQYYRKLIAYCAAPSLAQAQALESEFEALFSKKSGYQQLDERKQLTRAKASELLLVLRHPELPLHNNGAELAARTMVQRRNISYATQTQEGTKAWDIFMSLVATTRKLEISFYEYMRDRFSRLGKIPALGSLIREKSASNPFGGSWVLE